MQSPDTLTDLFRAHRRKITAQRQCIFRALEGDVTHPSAERVYEKVRHEMPNVSLKTVYQTLNDLVELGAITVLDVGTGSARFDPNVENVAPSPRLSLVWQGPRRGGRLPRATGSRRAAQGFDVDSAEVVFRGLCDECKRSQQ